MPSDAVEAKVSPYQEHSARSMLKKLARTMNVSRRLLRRSRGKKICWRINGRKTSSNGILSSNRRRCLGKGTVLITRERDSKTPSAPTGQ